jgi:hypothetical protein
MASIYFATCAITGPVAGVLFGGLIFKRMGGFENYKAFPVAVIIMALGSFSALPLAFIDSMLI